jgi:hypothetical protein
VGPGLFLFGGKGERRSPARVTTIRSDIQIFTRRGEGQTEDSKSFGLAVPPSLRPLAIFASKFLKIDAINRGTDSP